MGVCESKERKGGGHDQGSFLDTFLNPPLSHCPTIGFVHGLLHNQSVLTYVGYNQPLEAVDGKKATKVIAFVTTTALHLRLVRVRGMNSFTHLCHHFCLFLSFSLSFFLLSPPPTPPTTHSHPQPPTMPLVRIVSLEQVATVLDSIDMEAILTSQAQAFHAYR